MAEFQQDGITTILWPGGLNGNYGKSAAAIGYMPEWVLLGDGLLDANGPHRLAQNTAPSRATPLRHAGRSSRRYEQQRCYQAYREADPDLPKADVGYVCEYYQTCSSCSPASRSRARASGPTSIDKGFHAIPAVAEQRRRRARVLLRARRLHVRQGRPAGVLGRRMARRRAARAGVLAFDPGWPTVPEQPVADGNINAQIGQRAVQRLQRVGPLQRRVRTLAALAVLLVGATFLVRERTR